MKRNPGTSIARYFAAIFLTFVLHLALVLEVAYAQSPPMGAVTLRGNIETSSREEDVLVSARLSIVDGNGWPIPGLNADNVTVIENGRRVEGPILIKPIEQPMAVIFVIDRTAHMVRVQDDHSRTIEWVRNGIELFIENYSDDHDQVATFIIDQKINQLQDFLVIDPVTRIVTINNLRTNLSYDEVENITPCLLYQAIDEAVNAAERKEQELQTAIVVFTKQVIEPVRCSTEEKNEPIERAKDKHIPLFLADFDGSPERVQLRHSASLTSSTVTPLEDWFKSLEEQLRFQYSVSYSTDAPTGEYPVTIQVQQGGRPFSVQGRVSIKQPTPAPTLSPTATVVPPTPVQITPLPTPAPQQAQPQSTPEVNSGSDSSWIDFILLFASLVGIVFLGIIGFTFIRSGLKGGKRAKDHIISERVLKTAIRRKKPMVSALLDLETTLAAQLVVLDGPEELRLHSPFIITHAETIIGRLPRPGKDNYFALYNQTVSREHAEIFFDHNNREQGYSIRDISSEENYVMINGVSIQKYRPVTLRPGDIIEIGDVVLKFENLAPGSINLQKFKNDQARHNFEQETKELES